TPRNCLQENSVQFRTFSHRHRRRLIIAWIHLIRGLKNNRHGLGIPLASRLMLSKRVHAAWFVVHFFIITAVCFAGVFSLIAAGSTVLPSALDKYARKAELSATFFLGKEATAYSPVRRGIATYLHAAGIEAGYTFFAPNIPGYHKL